MTFTQRAARQMRQRLDDLLGTRAEAVVVGTFHRLALDLMAALTGAPSPMVIDEVEALGLLRDVLDEGAGRGQPPQLADGAVVAPHVGQVEL